MPTFAEVFCQQHRIPPERYVSTMLSRCLHWRARMVAPLLRLWSSEYFAADCELIRGVGRLKTSAELFEELDHFKSHPSNRDFFRRKLKLRISQRRVARIVGKALPRRPAG